MARFAWIVGVASWALFAGVEPAAGSPLKLSFYGGAYPFSANNLGAFDVTDGFSGYSTTQYGHVGNASEWPDDMLSKPISENIWLRAVLYQGSQKLAEATLTGPVTGSFYRTYGLEDDMISASYKGRGVVSDLWIDSGVDPTSIPSWFRGLAVDVSGERYQQPWTLRSEMTISAAPVPEPGSVIVFLAAAGGGLLAMRRRGGATKSAHETSPTPRAD